MALVAGRSTDELLGALASELARTGAGPYELCVIGGTALAVLGFVDRPTKDIDVVALGDMSSGALRLRKAKPLPEPLTAAVRAVAVQYSIEPTWLNAGPADLIDWGLPGGFAQRLVAVEYGSSLRVHFAGRVDQICFKTYAAADVAGRHLTDLVALAPNEDEMEQAFRWAVSQDPSAGFRTQLAGLADYMGVRHVLDRIEQ
jgi:hypothetical protein